VEDFTVTNQRLISCLVVVLAAFGAVAVNAQTTATVTVNCGQGQSINQALGQHASAGILIVEIQGICNENVVVTRDNVTLKGTSPTSDGIQAAVNGDLLNSAVWVRGARLTRIENLKLTGGGAGLFATDVSSPVLRVVNSRLEGNTSFGALLFDSIVQFEDTVFTSNGHTGPGTQANVNMRNTRLICVRCTFSNPSGVAPNVAAGPDSDVSISESSLTDGGVFTTDAILDVNDSTIDARPSQVSVNGTGQGQITLRRVQVGGPMSFFRGSNVHLLGVTQTRNEIFNLADDASFVRIGNAAPASGGPPTIPSTILGFNLGNFSNGRLQDTSQINGNLVCNTGANTFCNNPGNVSGTSSCALCPKP
jgi:hypothetical protein